MSEAQNDQSAAAAAETAARFARFARDEAPGRSERYAEWAAGVAGDAEICAALAVLPPPHRQPPLVFAVVRMLGAADLPGAAGFAEFARFFRREAPRIVTECAARSTQTNEPLRCAPLTWALDRVDGPIALVEVGASAGLCLFPDRYAYEFRADGAAPAHLGSGPVHLCAELRGGVAAPARLPDVVWRAGIDLAPRDAADADDRAWISGLVWPGETERARRIDAALDIAAAASPLLVAADASAPGVLGDLVARARSEAPDATVVVTTPGVLPHVPRAARERLIGIIRGLGVRWVTLDHAGAHDAWTRPVGTGEGFVLALDAEPIARADPLGAWIAPV